MANGVLSSPYFWGAASQGLAQGAQNFNQAREAALQRRLQKQQAERDQGRWEADRDFRERELALRRMQVMSGIRPPEQPELVTDELAAANPAYRPYVGYSVDAATSLMGALPGEEQTPWQAIPITPEWATALGNPELAGLPAGALSGYGSAAANLADASATQFKTEQERAALAGSLTTVEQARQYLESKEIENYVLPTPDANGYVRWDQVFDFNEQQLGLSQSQADVDQTRAETGRMQLLAPLEAQDLATQIKRGQFDLSMDQQFEGREREAGIAQTESETARNQAETEWQQIQNRLENEYGAERIEGELNYQRAQTALTEARAHWQRHQTDFVPVERIYGILGIPVPEGARGQEFYRDEMPMIFNALETLIREQRDPAQFTTLGDLLSSVGHDTTGMRESTLGLQISAEDALGYVSDYQLSPVDQSQLALNQGRLLDILYGTDPTNAMDLLVWNMLNQQGSLPEGATPPVSTPLIERIPGNAANSLTGLIAGALNPALAPRLQGPSNAVPLEASTPPTGFDAQSEAQGILERAGGNLERALSAASSQTGRQSLRNGGYSDEQIDSIISALENMG